MTLLDRLQQIERGRAAKGLSQQEVLRHAGLAHNTLSRWLKGTRSPDRAGIARYQQAVKRAGRNLSRIDGLVLNLWDVLVVLVAREHGLCPTIVRSQDPSKRANRSPDWVAAQQVRWEVIFLLNQVFGIGQSDIAAALNMTRAAIGPAVKGIIDRREGDELVGEPRDDVLHARLSQLEHDLTETM